MNKNEIDESIVLMVNESVNSIIDLWSDSGKSFWRSTSHREREPNQVTFYPTVSFRCLESLLSTVIDFPEFITENNRNKILNDILPSVIELDFNTITSTLNETEPDKTLNEFTLSVCIQSFSQIIKILDKADPKCVLANKKLIDLVSDLTNSQIFTKGDNSGIFREHPFILFHIVRAFSMSETHLSESLKFTVAILKEKIINNIRLIAEKELAKYQLGSMNPSDYVALTFCAAAISQNNLFENFQYLISSLKIVIGAQDESGCWPMGRLVHKNKDVENPKLEISTYEISWAIATIALEISQRNKNLYQELLTNDVLQSLYKSLRYTEKSIVHLLTNSKNITGWCSSQPYEIEIIESWTTANVLQFLCKFNLLIEKLRELEIRNSFPILYPSDRDWPAWLKWDKYKNEAEIDSEYQILSYLDNKIVKPIKNSQSNLPSSEDRTVSILLFGPPGTSKTTIVKAIAEGLDWPIIMLNPGQFIEGGLESIERLSQSVFNRLSQLSRVVVLFDECDELFRERSPKKDFDQTRGITAFVTACMLPKLQELHDRGKIVFFICTNNFESIDSAVKRGGRVDHVIGVGPPDRSSRTKIIDSCYKTYLKNNSSLEVKYWSDVSSKVAESTDRYTRSELIRVVNAILGLSASWTKKENANKTVKDVINNFEDSLTVTPEEMLKFTEQNKKYSHTVIEGVSL